MMTPLLLFACMSATPGADSAASLAADLAAAIDKVRFTTLVVTEIAGPEGDGMSRSIEVHLAKALAQAHGFQLVDRAALRAALQEAALATWEATDAMTDIAAAMGAQLIVSGGVQVLGEAYHINVRAVAVETGEVVAAALATLPVSGNELPTETRSLEAQLRRLADKLAAGLDTLDGDSRYQRYAVLPFEELGGTTKEKQLGLLVATEVATLLKRDHGLLMLERAQIAKVLGEVALGQSGAVDEATSVEVGRLAGAQGLIMGSVAEAGDRYLVHARVVSALTGQVQLAEEVALSAADLVSLSSAAVVLRTTAGAVYRSLILPGWGQLYNRQFFKGMIFVGLEVAALGTGLVFMAISSQHYDKYRQIQNGADQLNFSSEFELARQNKSLGMLAFGIMGGFHLLNVLDAFVSGTTYDTADLSFK